MIKNKNIIDSAHNIPKLSNPVTDIRHHTTSVNKPAGKLIKNTHHHDPTHERAPKYNKVHSHSLYDTTTFSASTPHYAHNQVRLKDRIDKLKTQKQPIETTHTQKTKPVDDNDDCTDEVAFKIPHRKQSASKQSSHQSRYKNHVLQTTKFITLRPIRCR